MILQQKNCRLNIKAENGVEQDIEKNIKFTFAFDRDEIEKNILLSLVLSQYL